jgi:hypothetical protein
MGCQLAKQSRKKGKLKKLKKELYIRVKETVLKKTWKEKKEKSILNRHSPLLELPSQFGCSISP